MHPQAPAELLQLHMDPPGPTPGHGDGMLLTDLPAEAVRAFVDAAVPTPTPTCSPPRSATSAAPSSPAAAVDLAAETGLRCHRRDRRLEALPVYAVGIAVPETMEAVVASLGRLLSRIEPWRAPVEYLNFAERPAAPSASSATTARAAARAEGRRRPHGRHPLEPPRAGEADPSPGVG